MKKIHFSCLVWSELIRLKKEKKEWELIKAKASIHKQKVNLFTFKIISLKDGSNRISSTKISKDKGFLFISVS